MIPRPHLFKGGHTTPRPHLFIGTRGGHQFITTRSAMDAPETLGLATAAIHDRTEAAVYDRLLELRPPNQGGNRAACGHTALYSNSDAGMVATRLLDFFADVIGSEEEEDE